MCRNIISVSCLDKDGFDFTIRDSVINIYRDDIYYGNGLLSNGLYVLNFNNDKPIYKINTKRIKTQEINPIYFWYCRLSHVNEKHIERLHKDGVLGSFDFESYDTCKSCLRGKMTNKESIQQSE